MTATNMIQVVDRFALGVMNALVFVGLPLFAMGFLVRAF